jgi:hypothetical protein
MSIEYLARTTKTRLSYVASLASISQVWAERVLHDQRRLTSARNRDCARRATSPRFMAK